MSTKTPEIDWIDPSQTPPKPGEEYLVWPRTEGATGVFDAKWGWRQGGWPVSHITRYAALPAGPKA